MPKSMFLDDLEQQLCTLLRYVCVSHGPYRENLIDQYYQQQNVAQGFVTGDMRVCVDIYRDSLVRGCNRIKKGAIFSSVK